MIGYLQTPAQGEISTFLSGGRLLIIANIGLEDMDRLQAALEKYREILTLCQDDPEPDETADGGT